ncbi:hypothetical protein H9L10_00905 [Phycicoccus endophyticus]|uniref:Uncharacterized protein n=1 Tax=Phycicoccus endophyticus TaxID=1690220 RepID=A0A7G9R5G9_9MICO|nr:hypothetical protein [Phycicoccus endophyticus]QNN50844.1 hypothetical protein H9L10_00905 [Phycicoccus endophyticus]
MLLPESVLSSDWFAVLAVFVAVNTVMYVGLAVAKVFPKLYPRDWFSRRYTRAQTRSIHPDATESAPPARRSLRH